MQFDLAHIWASMGLVSKVIALRTMSEVRTASR